MIAHSPVDDHLRDGQRNITWIFKDNLSWTYFNDDFVIHSGRRENMKVTYMVPYLY